MSGLRNRSDSRFSASTVSKSSGLAVRVFMKPDEKTYGMPVTHWFDIVKQAGPLWHMELVNLLKTEHKMGHGHANAIVGYVLAQK